MTHSEQSRRTGPVKYILGGRLALDFANTRLRTSVREDLPHYEAVADWAYQLGLIDRKARTRMWEAAQSDPRGERKAYAEAIELREAIYRTFLAATKGVEAASNDLELVSALAADARTHQIIAPDRSGYVWRWRKGENDLRQIALEVAVDAAKLLISGELGRVKECPPPDGCGWLFYDTSKNRSRRWCSMEFCGTAAKSRRFSERHRAGRKATSNH